VSHFQSPRDLENPSGILDVRSGDPIAAVHSGIEVIARHGRCRAEEASRMSKKAVWQGISPHSTG
jgi:hypothetical protein